MIELRRKREPVPVSGYFIHCRSHPRFRPCEDRLQLTIPGMHKRYR
jgi:hypothetical protein